MASPLLRSVSLLALAGAALSASAQNLVTNPGFETGDFTGWTQGGNTGATGVGGFPARTGTYTSYFGPVSSPGTLSQTLATQAGRSYTISFYLRTSDSSTDARNFFSTSFDGVTLGTITDPPISAYTLFTYTGTASTSSTLFQFTFQRPPAYFLVDDVSVTVNPISGVPGPAAAAAFGLGLLRRRRKG